MSLSNKAIYNKLTNSSLWVLWVGTLLLLLAMFYNWRSTNPRNKGILVDQLLLSSQDLELGENVNLINISLNKEITGEILYDDTVVNTPPERKEIYSKILKKKIKEISATPAKQNDGYTIKPLPQ